MSSSNICPSEAKNVDTCPFLAAGGQEADGTSLAEDLSKCSTFQKGACPFASKAKDDIEDMMPSSQTPVEHSTTSIKKSEYEVKLNPLNQFLPETHQKKAANGDKILSDPQLASAMKEGTITVHTAAENSVFTKRFLSGTIDKDEYGRYINSLYFVYKTMENLLNQHRDNSCIQMIYFPHELNREKALLKDLEYYYGKDRIAELISEKNTTPAVKKYIESLKAAAEKNPALLISHSYSRYLGDLSGGQILAKRLKKHVLKISMTDAAWDSYEGLEFYNFDHIGSHNEFKSLYRQRLDEAHVTQHTKDLIVAEAIHSFELNIALFNEIQELSESGQLHDTLSENEAYSNLSNGAAAAAAATKATTPNVDWLVGFATGVMTLAVGLSLYQKVSSRS